MSLMERLHDSENKAPEEAVRWSAGAVQLKIESNETILVGIEFTGPVIADLQVTRSLS